MDSSKKTSTGLDENVAALLSYVAWWVSGIVFLILEPDNKFVRFHAIQSIVVFGAVTLAAVIISLLPIVGGFLGFVIWAIGIALWIVLMVKAYQGARFKIPVAGDLAERWSEGQSHQPPVSK